MYPIQKDELGKSEDVLESTDQVGRLRLENERLRKEIAEARRAYAELQDSLEQMTESEERFRLLIAGVKDYAIFRLTPEGYVATWNEGAQRIKGYTAEEIIGKHFSTFYTQEDLDDKKPERELRIAVNEGKYEEEGWRVRKDGSLFWANVLITALFDSNGKLSGFAKVTRDLTERRKVQEQLRKKNEELQSSNSELEQFAYIASHDLQEPLRTVSSYVQLLETRYGDKIDEEGKEYIQFAVDGARRMRNLIHSLLEYSRVGRTNKQQEDVDLNETVNHIIAGFKLTYPDAQFHIGLLPVVCSVPIHMEQLFQNLIGNALKFSKAGQAPHVSVSAKQKGKMWFFEVSDNGIGLDEKYAERIFKIFQRLQTDQVYPGSGIGLAICKKIVELYGGKISVKSKVGDGATFCFTLPAQA